MTAQRDFENLDDIFVPLIRKEIERLESLEKLNHGYKEVTSGLKKFAYKHCIKGKSGNLNLNNKGAYGICSLCNECEHFSCSKTKDWRKANILNGSENYFCTNCYAKHHGNNTLQKHLGVMHEPSEIPRETTHVTKAIIHNTESLLIEDDEASTQMNTTTNTVKVSCSSCTESFFSEESLNVHILSQHTKDTIFQCDQCSETFTTEENLNVHVVYGHSEKNTSECDTCSKAFQTPEHLEVHIKFNHSKDRLIKCDLCTETFRSEEDITNHRVSKHAQQCSFQCHKCTETFEFS